MHYFNVVVIRHDMLETSILVLGQTEVESQLRGIAVFQNTIKTESPGVSAEVLDEAVFEGYWKNEDTAIYLTRPDVHDLSVADPGTISGEYVSVWEEGEVRTQAYLHDTGEVVTTPVDIEGMVTILRSYFESRDGREFPICSVCQSYICRPVLQDGIGHNLVEITTCSNPECESHQH